MGRRHGGRAERLRVESGAAVGAVTALIMAVAVLGGAASAQAVSDFQYHRNSMRTDALLLAAGVALLAVTVVALVWRLT